MLLLLMTHPLNISNKYSRPVIELIAEDENGHNQVVSFAVSYRRTMDDFIEFFSALKKRLGDVRVFVTDRNQVQFGTLEIVWPQAIIIYFLKHIERNIKNKLDF